MSEAVSALNAATASGVATVEEVGLRGMITLRGDLSGKAVAAAVKAAVGAGVPDVRRIVQGDQGAAAWMSPDELLLLTGYDRAAEAVAAAQDAMGTAHGLVVNVSDARAGFRVSGGGAREVLGKLSPVDFSAEAFGAGQFRRSRLAQVPAAIWANENGSLEVICFRSVAQYVFDLLRVSGETGGEVGFYRA
ncbi:sarcosine oxidase subunit gamma [Salinihabitans flavidus]|uniref:Sarcosine oxidase subunit gamma n=1 Tax=Salinihabitans flavidus TaxID=569882 RepID=A0A1H8NLY2_9RHOB|nr:sarcosine oxidase subunit gamma family protein [Salinihabitans flavidus]SEO30393.1 sarcosine oxidase subunit gamma [Salinihabitans flavidus]